MIKVARTVADLLGEEEVDAGALREAAGYRDIDPTADFLPFEGWTPDEEGTAAAGPAADATEDASHATRPS